MAQKRNTKTTRKPTAKTFGHPLKPVSPVINGVLQVRRRVPGRDCVLASIEDAQATLDEIRQGRISERNFEGLCEVAAVLDAARHILVSQIDKT